MSIRVAILGYGNLGRGMECAVKQNDDMELVAVFTRRDPATVKTLTDVKVYNVDQLLTRSMYWYCAEVPQPICRSRPQSMQSILMWWTVLIPMRRFPSILHR